MEFSVRTIEKFKIVGVKGNINTEDVAAFESKIVSLIDEDGSHIIIDLLNATYLCSHAISVIVRMWKKLVDTNGSIRIFVADSDISQVLEASNINKIVQVYASEQAFRAELLADEEQVPLLSVRAIGKYQIIEIRKPISMISGYRDLDGMLNELIAQGNKHLGLNLKSVSQIYSEMAGLINKWNWLTRQAGGTFCLINLNDVLNNRLSLMGLDRVVKIFDSEGEVK